MGNICGNDITDDFDEVIINDEGTKELDMFLQNQDEQHKAVSRLLLLGPGESGKSTIFKQMKILYSKELFAKEREYNKGAVFNNVVINMRNLLEACRVMTDDSKLKTRCNATNLAKFDELFPVEDIASQKALNLTEIGVIAKLWADPAIQETYTFRASFQISDSTAYFFKKENLERIASEKYIPSKMDILRTRVRTSGIIEHSYTVESSEFLVIDVGGQRTERGKWIYVFADVDAIVYVAALSGYDLKLYEDEKQNRMVEALQLFREIVNLVMFPRNTAMILFLNKVDLFEEKILSVDPADCHSKFADYKGGKNAEKAKAYFKNKFEGMSIGGRKVYTFFTTATDTQLMQKMFKTTQQIIINKELAETSGDYDDDYD